MHSQCTVIDVMCYTQLFDELRLIIADYTAGDEHERDALFC